MASPLDKVLEAARAAAEVRANELHTRVAEIRAALDAYASAAELTLAADLARRLSVEAPVAEPVEDRARTLRDLVLALPELGTSPLKPLKTPERVESAPAMKSLLDREGTSAPRRSSLEAYEASPEATWLWEETKGLETAAISAPVFKAFAAELAARARVLQDRGENAELIPERVIKKLTAMAGERGVKGIYGLARHHEGDWAELARKARAERERLQNGSSGLTQKLQIPPATKQKVAEKPGKPRPGDVEDEDDMREVEHLPALQAASRVKPVVLVGGLIENRKLDLIKKRFGIEPEWVETQNNMKAVQSLESRILDGHVTAVVILEGLGGHRHFEPLVGAARQTGTPLVYGDTAGTGALKKAFAELEERL